MVPWSKVLCLGFVDRIFDQIKKQLLIKWPKLRSSGQTLDQVKFDLPTMTRFFGRTMTWNERWGWRKGTLGLFCQAFKSLRFSVFKLNYFTDALKIRNFFLNYEVRNIFRYLYDFVFFNPVSLIYMVEIDISTRSIQYKTRLQLKTFSD